MSKQVKSLMENIATAKFKEERAADDKQSTDSIKVPSDTTKSRLNSEDQPLTSREKTPQSIINVKENERNQSANKSEIAERRQQQPTADEGKPLSTKQKRITSGNHDPNAKPRKDPSRKSRKSKEKPRPPKRNEDGATGESNRAFVAEENEIMGIDRYLRRSQFSRSQHHLPELHHGPLPVIKEQDEDTKKTVEEGVCSDLSAEASAVRHITSLCIKRINHENIDLPSDDNVHKDADKVPTETITLTNTKEEVPLHSQQITSDSLQSDEDIRRETNGAARHEPDEVHLIDDQARQKQVTHSTREEVVQEIAKF